MHTRTWCWHTVISAQCSECQGLHFRSSLLLRPALKPLGGAHAWVQGVETKSAIVSFIKTRVRSTNVTPASQRALPFFDECNGMFVMPPTDPWRSFHIQAIHSKEKIQHFSASHVFSLAVSIFSASSPTMLREVVPRNVVLHTDGRLFAHYILDVLNV